MLLEDKHILIFEDNPDNIQLLTMILEEAGAKVSLWFGGEKQEILALFPVDLIIIDLMLPGECSGFDLFGQLRSWPELDAVPIVAVSAMDTTLAIPKTRAAGFSGFISKPVDMDLFPHQIYAILEGQPVWYANPSVQP